MLCVCAVPGFTLAADIDVKGYVTTADYHVLKNVNVRVSHSNLSGERLIRELIRLRKQGKLPRVIK
jgi:hypothetical protein